MNLRFENFPQLLVPFAASHLNTARGIWLNKGNLAHFGEHAATDKESLVKKFAYIVPGGVTFDNLLPSEHDTEILYAERYGGSGIGENGGGARCGNIGGMQVKGVGKNILAGGDDIHHSYGGFKAAYAVHEAIYSSVLSYLLPVGVAGVHGIILTGPDAAYVSGLRRGWGGLLVREQSLRPANFLRASFFAPPQRVASYLLSDAGRVRAVNKQLLREAGDVSQVVRLFCRFLANAADQFAFARLAGIMHGAVSPSNQCLDGRWIDLTNTSFVGSAENCAGGNRDSASFHEEADMPIHIAISLIKEFAKFNCQQMGVQPFVDYYRECLSERYCVHLEYVLGLHRGSFRPRQNHSLLAPLVQSILKIHADAPVIYDRWPTDPPQRQPIFDLIACLFIAASGRPPESSQSNPQPFNSTWLLQFRQTLIDSKPPAAGLAVSPHHCIVGSAINAAKRQLLTPFFYKGRLERRVCQMLENDQIDHLEKYIPMVVNASKWILNLEDSPLVTMLELPELAIAFDSPTGKYVATVGSRKTRVFSETRDLIEWCGNLDPRLFVADEFDFLPYMRRALGLIERMDSAAAHAQR
ncbi:hypothetical protein J2X20_004596 [Pelomonas saccharophila]|uniref:Uncharacterized protein n=1 Tax=Roseateles saccharophilus TaxID=304 RepID=A0ABU1YST4_ROSSA|nr:hypothetical protein [Roseateles saccharophilus]MDR7271922.1 hypothetical protein [Roseateles saccharophilus]